MADGQHASYGSEDDALKHQLAALETQQKQLISLLGNDAESPLVQLQSELAEAIDTLRQKLQKTSAPPTPNFDVGDTCFAPRVFDRRRARAVVEAIDTSTGTCTVSWINPRQKGELPCRFWREGGCKFSGPYCPYSHGVQVFLGDLQPDTHRWLSQQNRTAPQIGAEGEQQVDQAAKWLADLRSGSRVLARYLDRIWYEAVAEGPASNGSLMVQFDGFEEEGSVPIPAAVSHLAPLESAGIGAESADVEGGDEDSGSKEAGTGDHRAPAPPKECETSDDDALSFTERILGDQEACGSKAPDHGAAGSLPGVYVFGEWERHTKSFGSRMMSRMGYRRGEGLGREKQGISQPIAIRVLPERRPLDHLREDDGASRARAAASSQTVKGDARKSSNRTRAEEEPQRTMFDFMNTTIHSGEASSAGAFRKIGTNTSRPGEGRSRNSFAGQRPVFDRTASSTVSPSDKPGKAAMAAAAAQTKAKKAAEMTKPELRAHLLEAREAESALAAKIARLEQAVERNAERDPRIASQARQKLDEVRSQAREVRASRDRAERALGDKADKGKSGGKGGIFAF